MADGKPEGSSDKFMGLAIIAVFLGVCLYFIYQAYTYEIHNIVRWVRYAEMWLVTLVTPSDYEVTLASGQTVVLEEFMEATGNIASERISAPLLGAMTTAALLPYRWVIVAILGLMGIWAYTKGPGTQYNQVFNLDSFLKFQSNAFPATSPFVTFNPSKQPPRAPGSPVPAELPLFAEALGPEEWLAFNQIPVPDGVIDEASAFKAFAKQLGPRWKGPQKLSPDKQVLMAAFCLKASRKRDEADEMLGRLAMCWTKEKGLRLSDDRALVRKARSILKNKDLSHNVMKQCKQHAWETTALLRALLVAREEGGVMAPAQFVWLRGHNRRLWYPLNNLGRQSCHMEAIGAMAHFRLERRAKRPIPRPKVEEAVESIVSYMGDKILARPIPALDYSKSKNKRGIKKLKSA
ncbi:MAG: type IV secretion system protein [Pseudomonadota bacterium]